jgi:hypothetical protein
LAGRAVEEVEVEGELRRRSELREADDGKGRKRKIAGIFFIFLEIRRGGEAVQIMVDEHRDAQIDNRRDL